MIYLFIILADYRLRHLVNNVAIHIYTHDYIIMEITVLYLNISRHQLSISWSQISVHWLRCCVTSKLNLRPSNLQLMPWNFQIQYSYLLNGIQTRRVWYMNLGLQKQNNEPNKIASIQKNTLAEVKTTNTTSSKISECL